MPRMTRSPVRRGRIGPPWCRSRELVMYARPRIKGTNAAAVAHAGAKMSMKFNIKYTKNESRKKTRNKKVQIHKQGGDRANT